MKKVNITTLSPAKYTIMMYEATKGEKKEPVMLDWGLFITLFEMINDRIDKVLPVTYHSGLEFKLTNASPTVTTRKSIWVDVKRGSKDWFITDIYVSEASSQCVNHVNWVEHLTKHQKNVLNHLSSPEWFGK